MGLTHPRHALRLVCVLALVAACLPVALFAQLQEGLAYTNTSTANINLLTTDIRPDDSLHLTTNLGNCTYTYDKDNIVVYEHPGTGELSFAVIDTTGGTRSDSVENDPLVMKFTDAGSIGGRSIDVTETVQRIDYSTQYVGGSTFRGTYVNFANLSDVRLNFGGIGVGSSDDPDLATTYTDYAWKNVDVRTVITYADTGEVVDLPFYNLIADLDVEDTYKSDDGSKSLTTKETWTAHDASYSCFNIYKDHCLLDISDTTDAWSGAATQFSAPSNLETSGEDELSVSGLTAITNGGEFCSQFTMANCATTYVVYSQYNGSTEQLAAPTKSVNKSTCSRGDTVKWTIAQRIGTFYQDTFSTYSSFGITDELPKGFDFISAKVTKEGSGDYTSLGTLRESGRTITFSFGDDFLNDVSNYDGSEYELVIKTTVSEETARGSYTNTAVSDISGIEQDCSAETTVIVPKVSIDKSTDADTYQIGDACTFTLTVNQTNKRACGYDVVVRDELPSYFTYLDDAELSGVDGEISFEDGTLLVEIPVLDYGQEATVTFSCLVDDDEDGSDYYTNVATVTVPHGNTDADEVQVQVLRPDPEVDEDDSGASEDDGDASNADGDTSGALLNTESIALGATGSDEANDSSEEDAADVAEDATDTSEDSEENVEDGEETDADAEDSADEDEEADAEDAEEEDSARFDKTGDVTDCCGAVLLTALALAAGSTAYGLRIRRRSARPQDVSTR